MKETLEYLLTKILDKDAVFEIEQQETPIGVEFVITIDDKFKPFVIGKGGRVIKALQNIVALASPDHQARVRITIPD